MMKHKLIILLLITISFATASFGCANLPFKVEVVSTDDTDSDVSESLESNSKTNDEYSNADSAYDETDDFYYGTDDDALEMIEITPPKVSPAPQDYSMSNIIFHDGIVDFDSLTIDNAYAFNDPYNLYDGEFDNSILIDCEISGTSMQVDEPSFTIDLQCYDSADYLITAIDVYVPCSFYEPFRYSFSEEIPKDTAYISIKDLQYQ